MNIRIFSCPEQMYQLPHYGTLVAAGWSFGDWTLEYFITCTCQRLSVWLADQTRQGTVKSSAPSYSVELLCKETPSLTALISKRPLVLAGHIIHGIHLRIQNSEMLSILFCWATCLPE